MFYYAFLLFIPVALCAGNNNTTNDYALNIPSYSELQKYPTKHYFKEIHKSINGKDYIVDIEPAQDISNENYVEMYGFDKDYTIDVLTDLGLKYFKQYVGSQSVGLFENIKEDVKSRIRINYKNITGLNPVAINREFINAVKYKIHDIISESIDNRIKIQDEAISRKSLEIEKQKKELVYNYKKAKLLVVGNITTALISALITAGVGLIVHFTQD